MQNQSLNKAGNQSSAPGNQSYQARNRSLAAGNQSLNKAGNQPPATVNQSFKAGNQSSAPGNQSFNQARNQTLAAGNRSLNKSGDHPSAPVNQSFKAGNQSLNQGANRMTGSLPSSSSSTVISNIPGNPNLATLPASAPNKGHRHLGSVLPGMKIHADNQSNFVRTDSWDSFQRRHSQTHVDKGVQQNSCTQGQNNVQKVPYENNATTNLAPVSSDSVKGCVVQLPNEEKQTCLVSSQTESCVIQKGSDVIQTGSHVRQEAITAGQKIEKIWKLIHKTW